MTARSRAGTPRALLHADDSLTTERLRLRRYTADDLELLVRMHTDAEVMRFVGGLRDRAGSESMMQGRILAYYAEHPGLGVWATIERATGECVGMHNLNHLLGEPDIQVGYILERKYWGLGYATEMCVALLRYGFATLGLPRIVGITDTYNVASQHVLRKSGLVHTGQRELPHPAYAGGPLEWFERDASSWLAEHPGVVDLRRAH